MQEKNKAVEKTEKAQVDSESVSKPKSSVKKAVKNNSGKSRKAYAERSKNSNATKKAKSNEAKIKKQELRAERERIQAEKRIEKAKIKAEKKLERKKLKQARLREKQKHIAELKKLKEEKKAEKNALKERRKSETGEQRHKRIIAERQEKARLKQEKRRLKAQLKKQKAEERKEKRQLKNQNKSKGFGGWLAAVISLGVTVLALSSVLAMTLFVPDDMDAEIASAYQKSYYDTVSYVNNMDLGLSKTISTKDDGARQQYLLDLAVNSELAENDINRLPLLDEDKYYTTKLINQIGDYAKYLNNKIIAGENLTSEDISALKQLYESNKQLKAALSEISAEMGDKYDFTKLRGKKNALISGMEKLQNLSVEYPELIYDGPFSDGRTNRQIKGLDGKEISPEEAKKVFTELFNDYGISDIKDAGETVGDFAAYNFTAKVNGNELFAQITKKGGRLLMFDCFEDCNEINYDGEDLISTAKEFLSMAGFKDMQPVWVSSSNAVTSMNFAYEVDGVIVYSDLVKVTVCQTSGMVTGLEASGYFINHVERNITSPEISKAAAKENVSDDLEIIGTRTALIPVGNASEKLAYEFKCLSVEDELYYVYIDATTGKQLQMFKVISSDDGIMLL